MKISSRHLSSLRKVSLLAERKSLIAQLTYHSVKRLTLELERKYSLLNKDSSVDIHTGDIQEEDTVPVNGRNNDNPV